MIKVLKNVSIFTRSCKHFVKFFLEILITGIITSMPPSPHELSAFQIPPTKALTPKVAKQWLIVLFIRTFEFCWCFVDHTVPHSFRVFANLFVIEGGWGREREMEREDEWWRSIHSYWHSVQYFWEKKSQNVTVSNTERELCKTSQFDLMIYCTLISRISCLSGMLLSII